MTFALETSAKASAAEARLAPPSSRTARTFTLQPVLLTASSSPSIGIGGSAPAWAQRPLNVAMATDVVGSADGASTLIEARRLLEWLSSHEELSDDQLIVFVSAAAAAWSFGVHQPSRHLSCTEGSNSSFVERYRRLAIGSREIVFAASHECNEHDAPWPTGCLGSLASTNRVPSSSAAHLATRAFLAAEAFAGPKRHIEQMLLTVLSYPCHKVSNHRLEVSPQVAFARFWVEHPHAVALDEQGSLFTSLQRFRASVLSAQQVEPHLTPLSEPRAPLWSVWNAYELPCFLRSAGPAEAFLAHARESEGLLYARPPGQVHGASQWQQETQLLRKQLAALSHQVADLALGVGVLIPPPSPLPPPPPPFPPPPPPPPPPPAFVSSLSTQLQHIVTLDRATQRCQSRMMADLCDQLLSEDWDAAKKRLLDVASAAHVHERSCALVAPDASAAGQPWGHAIDGADTVVRLGLTPGGGNLSGLIGGRTSSRYLTDACLAPGSVAQLAALLSREANESSFTWFAAHGRRSSVLDLHDRYGRGGGVRVLPLSVPSEASSVAGAADGTFSEEVSSLHGVAHPSLSLLTLHHLLTRGGCGSVHLFGCSANCTLTPSCCSLATELHGSMAERELATDESAQEIFALSQREFIDSLLPHGGPRSSLSKLWHRRNVSSQLALPLAHKAAGGNWIRGPRRRSWRATADVATLCAARDHRPFACDGWQDDCSPTSDGAKALKTDIGPGTSHVACSALVLGGHCNTTLANASRLYKPSSSAILKQSIWMLCPHACGVCNATTVALNRTHVP